jgi:hypothetical protein
MWMHVAGAAVAIVVAFNLLAMLLLSLRARSDLPELHELPGWPALSHQTAAADPSASTPQMKRSAERDRARTSSARAALRSPVRVSLIFAAAAAVFVGLARTTK